MTALWPKTHVDEANIRVHVTALRKVLGGGHSDARYIENTPGRGYRFIAPVLQHDGTTEPAAARPESSLPRPRRD
jgi:DNA-binding winged helix-turn-helix (wHTH) protein